MNNVYKWLRLTVLAMAAAVLTMIVFTSCSNEPRALIGDMRPVVVTSVSQTYASVRMPQQWTEVYLTDGTKMYKIFYIGLAKDVGLKPGDSLNLLIVEGVSQQCVQEVKK